MHKQIHLIVLIGLLFTGCSQPTIDPEQLVVEGWIAEGEEPVVLLHRSYVLAQHKEDTLVNMEDIVAEQLILFGRVAISDGTNEVVLTGRIDRRYNPPTVYTTTGMVGEAGKTYTLTADYKDLHVTAKTTLLPAKTPDSVAVCVKDTDVNVTLHMSDFPKEERSYYAVHYAIKNNRQYLLCPMGSFAAEAGSGPIAMNIIPGGGIGAMPVTRFHTSDTIMSLRVSRVTEESYTMYMALAAQALEQGVYYVAIYKNIPTNIQGGLGYWIGLGAKKTGVPLMRDTVIHCR